MYLIKYIIKTDVQEACHLVMFTVIKLFLFSVFPIVQSNPHLVNGLVSRYLFTKYLGVFHYFAGFYVPKHLFGEH